jgi:hypothetical protein
MTLDTEVKLNQHNLIMIGLTVAIVATFIVLVVKISKRNA